MRINLWKEHIYLHINGKDAKWKIKNQKEKKKKTQIWNDIQFYFSAAGALPIIFFHTWNLFFFFFFSCRFYVCKWHATDNIHVYVLAIYYNTQNLPFLLLKIIFMCCIHTNTCMCLMKYIAPFRLSWNGEDYFTTTTIIIVLYVYMYGEPRQHYMNSC